MPKVSIVVPVYNVEDYIERCVNSILIQTLEDFELILVNDGSTDNSGDICENYAMKDSRIKVIHKENCGLSDARNAGIDISTGDYIGFVDSDDYVEDNMYELLYRACIDNNINLSMCGRFDVYGQEKIPAFTLDESKIWTSEQAIENLLMTNNIDSSTCDKLFRGMLFENTRFPEGKYNEDIFIVPNIIHEAKIMIHIGEAKYNYCHREGSITSESFSMKKLDLLEANEALNVLIDSCYPEMRPLADSFYYHSVVFLNSIIQSKNIRAEHYDSYISLKKLLKHNIYNILSDKHLDNVDKKKSLLILFNIYTPVEKLVLLTRKFRR